MTPDPKLPPQPLGTSPALLFVLSCMWIVVSLAGGRLAAALVASDASAELVRYSATAAMLFGGFYVAGRWSVPDLRPLSSIGFVRRPTAPRELALGIALGWGAGLALMLPALLSGDLSMHFQLSKAGLHDTLLAVLLVCSFTVCVQLVVSGLPARLLVRAIGPTWTVVAVAILGIAMALPGRPGDGRGLLYTSLALTVALAGFLRTRAIWISLGVQAGFMGSLLALFGTTSPYLPWTPGLVRSEAGGAVWLTGGFYGPEASAFSTLR